MGFNYQPDDGVYHKESPVYSCDGCGRVISNYKIPHVTAWRSRRDGLSTLLGSIPTAAFCEECASTADFKKKAVKKK